MRNLNHLDDHRRLDPLTGNLGDETCGMFSMRGPCGMELRFRVSGDFTGHGWDHVSVSLVNRTPNWKEMCFVKDLCFEEDEVVMQLHVAKKDHINLMPHCLHLWRPHNQEIPQPASAMV